MKYSCEPVFVDDYYCWIIQEIQTEHVIAKFYFEDDALEYLRFLEYGGAFDGYTPEFMLKSMPKRDNINAEFERVFS